MYPQTIIDKAIPLLDGSTAPSIGSDTNPVVTDSGASVPQTQANVEIPPMIIAQEVQSQSFDSSTKKIKGAFSFESLGGITIGEYQAGVSGQIEITSDGIVATDFNGVITFSLDGATGNATFLGTVVAGTILAGTVITGAVVQDGSININNAFIITTAGVLKSKTGVSLGDTVFWDDGVTQANEVARINSTNGLKMFTNMPITLRGTSSPGAAVTNGVNLYVDQSAGKNRLMAIFPTGVAQVVAVEP